MFLFFFFFSSRRRHTRSLRDWSSDVCSSDLLGYQERHTRETLEGFARRHPDDLTDAGWKWLGRPKPVQQRSEERRVGKECRSRWWPDHLKKKNKIEED